MKDLSKALKILIVYHIAMSLLCIFVSGSLYAQLEKMPISVGQYHTYSNMLIGGRGILSVIFPMILSLIFGRKSELCREEKLIFKVIGMQCAIICMFFIIVAIDGKIDSGVVNFFVISVPASYTAMLGMVSERKKIGWFSGIYFAVYFLYMVIFNSIILYYEVKNMVPPSMVANIYLNSMSLLGIIYPVIGYAVGIRRVRKIHTAT